VPSLEIHQDSVILYGSKISLQL